MAKRTRARGRCCAVPNGERRAAARDAAIERRKLALLKRMIEVARDWDALADECAMPARGGARGDAQCGRARRSRT